MLEELVARDHIMARAEALDWKDAVRKAGSLLAESGDIEEAYIDEMIRSVEELGPYMVIAKGFALAHAAPSISVKRNSVSLINLKEGIDFEARTIRWKSSCVWPVQTASRMSKEFRRSHYG